MDYPAYRRAYFVDPAPEERFAFSGPFGLTLFYAAFAEATAYYTRVLGSPGYVEGADTRGWPIGSGWLTLLASDHGTSTNVEVQLALATPQEAERLQAAFIAHGGTGPAPSDQLMYEPIRSCPVRDPFGVDWLIFSRLTPPS